MNELHTGMSYGSLRGIRFTVVDDDYDVALNLADTLVHLTSMECAGVFSEGGPALEYIRRQRVQVVLLDLHMPAMAGDEFLRRLKRQEGAAVPTVLVLTCDDSDRALDKMLGWGADGFLVKGGGIAALADGIKNLLAGGAALSPHLTRRLIRRNFHPPTSGLSDHPSLTPREQQILDCLGRGYPYKQIAGLEGISMETVKTHARRIYRKLGVHSRAEAVAVCWREGGPKGK